MTIGEWLDARGAGVPPHLMQRVREALGDKLAEDVSAAPERCAEAAAHIADTLLAAGSTGRDSALSLLAADALVTFAFEAAADAPARLQERAHAAMRTLAAD